MNTYIVRCEWPKCGKALTVRAIDFNQSFCPEHAIATQAMKQVEYIAGRLRDTANGLRDGSIHPAHAANRLDKIANQLCKETAEGK